MHAQNVRGVNGNLNFTGQYSNAAGTTGLGYADFVTGQLKRVPARAGPSMTTIRSDYYGLYVQDAWRVAPHFSVNLGLRFEPYLPQRNTDDYVETFNMANFLNNVVLTPPKSTPPLTKQPGRTCSSRAITGFIRPNQQYNNRAEHFLPRIRVVWDRSGDGENFDPCGAITVSRSMTRRICSSTRACRTIRHGAQR